MNPISTIEGLVLLVVGIALGFAFGVYWAVRRPRKAKQIVDDTEVELAKAHIGHGPAPTVDTFPADPVPVDPNGKPITAAQTVVKPGA